MKSQSSSDYESSSEEESSEFSKESSDNNERDHGIIINMEAAEGAQYADKTLNIDEVRTAGGHPRTGIAWLDKHLEGLETWQIEEVLTITQLKPGQCVAAAGTFNPRNLREKKNQFDC